MKKLIGRLMPVVCCLMLSGCQTIQSIRSSWKASPDATQTERMKQLEKQVEVLTSRLESLEYELRFNVAANQVSLGKYDDAIRAFREIVNLSPGSAYAADSLYEIAKIHKYHLKNPAKAVATYEELLNRYPKSEFGRTASFEIAEGLSMLGKKTEALEKYQSFITRFGRDPLAEKAYFEIGDIYQQDKKFASARETYQRLVEQFPKGSLIPAALYRLAVCSLSLSDTAAALRYYDRVYTEFPATDFAELAFYDEISALASENADTVATAGLSEYLIRFPNGRFRSEAERLLNRLQGKKSPAP